jgi:prepilin-type N-terminal cleavage/methylation domain-containing protein
MARSRSAFSLIELLVVVAIISGLAGLLLHAVQKVRATALRTQDTYNLRQQALALQGCNDTHGRLPPVYNTFPHTYSTMGSPAGMGTLQYFLLPYLEQENLYNQVLIASDSCTSTPLKVFISPADPTMPANGLVTLMDMPYGGCSYAGNHRVFGNDPGGSTEIPAGFPDGAANTIAFGPMYTQCNGRLVGWSRGMCGPPPAWPYPSTSAGYLSLPLPQLAPSSATCDPMRLQSPYAGGTLVGMGDGSVRLLSAGISAYSWNLALNPSDGLALDSTW